MTRERSEKIEDRVESTILELLSSEESHQRGFVLLMERYREVLYWHIRRMVISHEDTEDVLQETFVKVYKYIGEFRGNSSLKTWLYKVATNEAIRHINHNRIETRSYDDENSRLIEIFEGDSSIDFSSMEAKLQRAIISLSPKQRVVFNLRYYDELSYQQIAEVTDTSVGTLKTNYHYAMTKIKEYMLNQIED
ncbi:MAG: RNA polymerase sigma factor [Rikenellaceae bacterium]